MTRVTPRSLDRGEIPHERESADVCIVGAGAAGIYLASRLARCGLKVVVLEAGPSVAVDAELAGFVPEFERESYSGAWAGRAFGLGGTTARWGGQLIPTPSQDAARSDETLRSSWSLIVSACRGYAGKVARTLGLPEGGSASGLGFSGNRPAWAALSHVGLQPLESVWLPFRARNLAWLLNSRHRNGALKVYLDATASVWALTERAGSAWIGGVEARSASGRRLTVAADRVVVCAGAIESTRILLEIDDRAHALPKRSEIGSCLSDHFSACIGEVVAKDRSLAASIFGPRFAGGLMRSVRIIDEKPELQTSRWFAHMLFEREDAAFRCAKAVLQAMQARRVPRVALTDLLHAPFGLSRLAWARFVEGRLFIPPETPTRLQLDIEQRPQRHNRVSLGHSCDRFGRPRCRITWGMSELDGEDFKAGCRLLARKWSEAGSALPRVHWLDSSLSLEKAHGAYHPTGTCRVGEDDEAVVDPDLKVRGYGNLYLLSTCLFPSAGSANPTFSLLCLVERLAETLQQEWKKP